MPSCRFPSEAEASSVFSSAASRGVSSYSSHTPGDQLVIVPLDGGLLFLEPCGFPGRPFLPGGKFSGLLPEGKGLPFQLGAAFEHCLVFLPVFGHLAGKGLDLFPAGLDVRFEGFDLFFEGGGGLFGLSSRFSRAAWRASSTD